MKTKPQSQSREEQDKAMIADPNRWPCWPWLPVKRHRDSNSNLECGLVHADDNGTPYQGHPSTEIMLFAGTSILEVRTYFPTKEMRDTATRYASIDAMLVDGWKVD